MLYVGHATPSEIVATGLKQVVVELGKKFESLREIKVDAVFGRRQVNGEWDLFRH